MVILLEQVTNFSIHCERFLSQANHIILIPIYYITEQRSLGLSPINLLEMRQQKSPVLNLSHLFYAAKIIVGLRLSFA